MKPLHVTPAAAAIIRAHGQDAYPHECCGALLGANGEVQGVREAFPLPNTTEEGPRRRFLVRAADYREAERARRRSRARVARLLSFAPRPSGAPVAVRPRPRVAVVCLRHRVGARRRGRRDDLVAAARRSVGLRRRADRDRRGAGLRDKRLYRTPNTEYQTEHDQSADSHAAPALHRQAGRGRDRGRDGRRAARQPDDEVCRRCATISTPAKGGCAASSTSTSTTRTSAISRRTRRRSRRATPSASSRRWPAATGAIAAPSLPALSADEIQRYSRHLILPEVGMDGQRKLKAAKVLCIGAGGLGSPAALYLAAAGVGTHRHGRLRRRRLSNLQRQLLHGTPDVGRPEAGVGRGSAAGAQPERGRLDLRDGAHLGQRAGAVRAVRHHHRRHRQLPDPLPGQRRLRAARQAERLRQHLPLRGPGVGVRRQGRAVLSLPVSRAAAAGAGAELRRGRRARRAARHHRHDPGHRGDQADPRHRRAAGRPLAALRRAADEVPRAQAAPRPGLPGLRRSSDRDDLDRLRTVLRRRSHTPPTRQEVRWPTASHRSN